MAGVTRTVVLTSALICLVPWWHSPAGAQETGEDARRVVEEEYDGCTFRLINGYAPDGRTQYARTRQVWSEDCTFGSRNWSIRVRVCFDDPEAGNPVNCSGWLMPTAQTPYAEAETTGAPAGSVHYVEIRGSVRRFTVPPPEPVADARESSPTAEPSGTQAEALDPADPDRGGHTDSGLAAVLAAGGMALLGLGGTAIWLLRRGGSGSGIG